MSIVYLGKATLASGNGGGSITVDQAYNAISTNAQSGTAVAEALATITSVQSVDNANTNVGAISPLKVWNGTEQEWNTGGGSITWYRWENEDISATPSQVYTTDRTPTTSSEVYNPKGVLSNLTVTQTSSSGVETITLSNNGTYQYMGSSTQTVSIGEAHPDWLCNIDGVGVKIGTTDIANLASYSAFTGATSSVAGSAGLVPAPTTSDIDKYLKGDGTWAAVSGGGLQNTATGTNSLTILGVEAYQDNEINIGYNSGGNTNGICIGVNSSTRVNGVTIGTDISNSSNRCVQIGYQANTQTNNTTVIGCQASVGENADYSIAIGRNAIVGNVATAIQIGYGTNNTAKSLFVGFYDSTSGVAGNYQLLDGTTGKIPNDRINVDANPTQNSTNFVTSGTIYSVLGNINTLLAAI